MMTLTEARKVLTAFKGNTANTEVAEAIDTVLGTASEPTFILRTRDRFAANCVRTWIYSARVLGEGAKSKIEQASDVLDRMMAFREKNDDLVKNPE